MNKKRIYETGDLFYFKDWKNTTDLCLLLIDRCCNYFNIYTISDIDSPLRPFSSYRNRNIPEIFTHDELLKFVNGTYEFVDYIGNIKDQTYINTYLKKIDKLNKEIKSKTKSFNLRN